MASEKRRGRHSSMCVLKYYFWEARLPEWWKSENLLLQKSHENTGKRIKVNVFRILDINEKLTII